MTDTQARLDAIRHHALNFLADTRHPESARFQARNVLALAAELERVTAAANTATELAGHLFQMIDPQTWRDWGADDGQGHYEGDYRAEKVGQEIAELRAALAGGVRDDGEGAVVHVPQPACECDAPRCERDGCQDKPTSGAARAAQEGCRHGWFGELGVALECGLPLGHDGPHRQGGWVAGGARAAQEDTT
jgi:hypothetical protein